jgi:hypothetical protein
LDAVRQRAAFIVQMRTAPQPKPMNTERMWSVHDEAFVEEKIRAWFRGNFVFDGVQRAAYLL